MIPIFFKIGSFTVYSYGVMLAAAFLVGNYILSLELKRENADPKLATNITFLAIIFGILGAKLFHIFENFQSFLNDPAGEFFSPGGLIFYGGLITAVTAVYFYIKKEKISFLFIMDSIAPALALAYGIGRIGCHLYGDGDYGIPTKLPWGTIYANGTVKPHNALIEYFKMNPEKAAELNYYELSSQVIRTDQFGKITAFDQTILLHPTPLYELILGVLLFSFLWSIRKRIMTDGKIFMIYLFFTGVFRFSIEFLRLNPTYISGLSQAQIISIFLMILSLLGYYLISKKIKNHFNSNQLL